MITFSNIGYYGRFGNQLFQFALAFSVAKKTGYDLILPYENLINRRIQNARDKSFDAYCNLLECFDINQNYFGNYKQPIKYIFNESQFHYDENVFNVHDNTSFHGYFQSEKYFIHCREELLNELTIKSDILNSAEKLLPKTDKQLVSIHVRRGDNAIPQIYHPCVGLEFINPVIEEFFNTDEYHFCIISDDPNWCREIWKDKENFSVLEGDNQHVDFAILSLCDHHIISNSSFSWWSSYISKNKDKKIIAPKNWFGIGYAHYNLDDLHNNKTIIR
jgi:hypothetical protein